METTLLERYIKEVLKESDESIAVSAEDVDLPKIPKDENEMTWGDLRKVVEAIRNEYGTKDFVKKGIKIASLIPGFAASALIDDKIVGEIAEIGVAKLLALAYNINGNKPPNKSTFQIDPHVSKVIDDDVEKEFIYWFAKHIKDEKNDSDKLVNFDMTKELSDWLKDKKGNAVKYGGVKIEK